MRSLLLRMQTCRGDVRATAHFQQFESVAVIGHQNFERGVIHRRVIDLQGREGFGVDKDHRQSRDEVRLWTRARGGKQSVRWSKIPEKTCLRKKI